MQIEHDIFSGLGNVEPMYRNSSKTEDADRIDGDEISIETSRYRNMKKALDGISIIPVYGDMKNLEKKKFNNLFHHVFLSQHTAHWIGLQEFRSILRSESDDGREQSSSVDVETGKFIFQLGKKDQGELLEKIKRIGEGNGLCLNLCRGKEEIELNTVSFSNACN